MSLYVRCAALSAVLLTSFCNFSSLAAMPSERTTSLESVPIEYGPNQHERELFGYQPRFQPAVISFDPENRPYMRLWHNSENPTPEIQTLRDTGEWILLDYGRHLPDEADPGFYTGLGDYRVVFDRHGDVYLVVDAAGAGDSRWYLMHSTDRGRTWISYELPFGPMPGNYGGRSRDGNRALVESNSQSGLLEHPPVIMGNDETHLLLLVPEKKQDGTLHIPEPVPVVDVSGDAGVEFDVSWKAGWGGNGHGQQKIVSRGDDIFFTWARPVRPNAHPGTPQYVAHFSRSQGKLINGPVYVGSNGIEVDSHNQPALGIDSKGYLHLMLGAHGTIENPHETVLYASSVRPLDVSEFAEPVRLPAAGCTYPSIAIDSKDTIHVVTRKYDTYGYVTPDTFDEGYTLARRIPGDYSRGFDHLPRSRVAYFRKKSGEDWTYTPLVVSHFGGYVFWSNHVTVDNRDRVFVSYLYSPRAEQVKRPIPSTLLMSQDGGDSWDLAITDDFTPGTTP